MKQSEESVKQLCNDEHATAVEVARTVATEKTFRQNEENDRQKKSVKITIQSNCVLVKKT